MLLGAVVVRNIETVLPLAEPVRPRALPAPVKMLSSTHTSETRENLAMPPPLPTARSSAT